jgi:hypothetical protein
MEEQPKEAPSIVVAPVEVVMELPMEE